MRKVAYVVTVFDHDGRAYQSPSFKTREQAQKALDRETRRGALDGLVMMRIPYHPPLIKRTPWQKAFDRRLATEEWYQNSRGLICFVADDKARHREVRRPLSRSEG
jgi:hypothetical protein